MKRRFSDIRIKKGSFFERLEEKKFQSKKEEIFFKKVKKEEPSFKKEETPLKEKKRFSFKNKKILNLFLTLFFIFIFLFFLFSFFQRVELTIKQNPQEINFEDKIAGNTKISDIDFAQKIIPGKLLDFEKEVSETFPCTGETVRKAEGKIKLYNAYTTSEETWREKTRFVSSDGKIFLSKDKIVVPGAKMKEGKLEPSVVEVPVVAIEGGESYNIGPSKFSVLAFKGSERFFKYWGESTESMKGGGKGTALKKEDLEKAKKAFGEKIEKEKISQILQEKAGKEKIVPEGCFTFSVSDESFSKKEGEGCDNFEMKAKLRIKALGIEKNIIDSLKENLIAMKFKEKNKFLSDGLTLKCEGKDFDNGVFSLNLKVNGKIVQEFDVNELKRKIVGRNIEETKAILESLNFEKVKIKLFPWFLRKIPENFDKIKINFETP
jgi:hypothetical protein